MSNKFYSYEVSYLMENSISPSLNILLEEEEDKKEEDKKEDKKDDFGDSNLFSDEGESDGDSDSDSADSPSESEDAGGEGDAQEGGSSSDAEGAKEKGLENLATNLEDVINYYKSVTSDSSNLFQVQEFLSQDIASKGQEIDDKSDSVQTESYSLIRKNSIGYFLNEKVDVERIEKDIEAVDNIIDKGSELIDKFKKGTKINIPQYVESSINAYRNFDNLFSKEIIIKQAAMNLIVLNSGAKAEENIREFEELFHEELHKQFGIEYEEHAVITKPHHVATGAVKQG